MSEPRFGEAGYISLTQLLQQHAEQYPDDVAMRQKEFGIWQETTWRQYRDRTHAIAAGLTHLGIGPQEHVGIISENRQEWIVSQLGINSAGAVTCGIYPTSPVAEVVYLLDSADCKAVFCEDQEQVDKVLAIRDRLPKLEHILVFDPKGLEHYDRSLWRSLDDLIEDGRVYMADHPDCIQERLAQQQPDDTALIVFTSGSTGLPKAAMISFHNIWAQMALLWDAVPSAAHQNILSYLPLCHVAEQAFSTMNAMSRRMVVNFGESLRTIRTDLQEISPQMFFGVPRIWEKMQSELVVLGERTGPLRRWLLNKALTSAQKRGAKRKADWSPYERLEYTLLRPLVYRPVLGYLGLARCDIAMTAAAPISADLLALFRGMGLPLIEIWGMTETTGAATLQDLDLTGEGRIGRAISGLEVKVGDDGELLVKGPTVFKGYYNNDTATRETIVDGWLHTGDVVDAHPDGTYTIVDRKKDIIINAAGKNLSPSVIENTIKASPFIKECIVIGDQRKYVAALIQIDYDTVATWADRHNLAYTTFKSLAEHPEVYKLIQSEVDKGNDQLARVEQIKRFTLLTKELDHDDGEVTATMKVRRKKVAEQYGELIESLFQSPLTQ
ncbi:AMP-dependent synthetase/ligase [Saccharospirillum salsuginis]|uniref:Long-chain-fatty-acid--CoA ligase n=1 Tax=Saccharospirillum salsuginis TaxID=418750 RepID=A0A918K084_9GAMM|nr:AMP-binding protein [Saccharospirillum salsuginis]GGX38581.1 long-chain-fatty-acid--CoA ligase [Saccharospirillum salsuginis]